MFSLDMRTIIFSHVVTDIVCILVVLQLWQQSRKRFEGTGFWMLDYTFQTAAVFLIILRGSIPDWISMTVSNTLVIGGTVLGYMGFLPVQQVSSSTRVTNVFTGNVSEDHHDASGIGDFRMQPLWLTWRFTHFNIGMAYAFYAPTGKNRIDSPVNTGLGFWSHQFQVPFALHFDDSKSLSLVGAATYEINHEKSDAHLTPGSHFTMNYGLSKIIYRGKGLFDLAVLGYSQWQVTDDSGPGIHYDPSVHDRIHAVGGQILYSYPPWNSMASVKYFKEYGAVDRLQGDVLALTLTYRF